MKKKKGKWKLLVLSLISGLLFTGCGSSKQYAETAAADTAAYESAYDAGGTGYLSDGVYSAESYEEAAAAAEENGAAPAEGAGEGASGDTPAVQDTSRKLIRNVNLDVETETFDELLSSVQNKIDRLGGYIEESFTYNGSSYYGQDYRNANLSIRIPADKLNEFLSDVAEISNVIRRNESVTDVTLQYVDMESHKKMLREEQERLLELLEQAESMEDIIAIESRLTDVRYQLESMEAQLRTIDNQVNYSTVYLNINEVERYTPPVEKGTWERIGTGFMENVYRVGDGIKEFFIGFVVSLPILFVLAVLALAAALIVRAAVRVADKRSAKRKPKPGAGSLYGVPGGFPGGGMGMPPIPRAPVGPGSVSAPVPGAPAGSGPVAGSGPAVPPGPAPGNEVHADMMPGTPKPSRNPAGPDGSDNGRK